MTFLNIHEAQPSRLFESRRSNQILLRLLTVLVLAILLTASSGFIFAASSKTIKVKASADTRALETAMDTVSFKILFPCMTATSKKFKAQGKAQSAAEEQAEQQCPCMKKDLIEPQLKTIDAILQRHPDWKGHTIEFSETNSPIWNELREAAKTANKNNAGATQKQPPDILGKSLDTGVTRTDLDLSNVPRMKSILAKCQ